MIRIKIEKFVVLFFFKISKFYLSAYYFLLLFHTRIIVKKIYEIEQFWCIPQKRIVFFFMIISNCMQEILEIYFKNLVFEKFGAYNSQEKKTLGRLQNIEHKKLIFILILKLKSYS